MASDHEQAGELKFGQVGIANLRVRTWDVDKLTSEMAERVRTAPKLFAQAAVVLDFSALSVCPTVASVKTLITKLHESGVLPVAIAYGASETERLAHELHLPLLAKFRASYERAQGDEPAATSTKTQQPVATDTAPAKSVPPAQAASASEPGLMQLQPVRSGQQVYAQNRDLTVCATVGAGAEVIADGSIHIYGALRGRALAGAAGQTNARIFCREFHAELVAIAGTYKVLEELPKQLIGKSVQIWLDNGQILIETLT